MLHSPASLIPKRYEYINRIYKNYKKITFISVSEFVKKTSEKYLNAKRNIIINHGLDFSTITKKVSFDQDNKLKILTVAALESWKGIQHVISVFDDIKVKKNFEYYIVGEGPYYDELYQEVKKNEAEKFIFFLGNKEDVNSLYYHYDIYCHLSDGEAFGLSVLEAMGAGLPTIVNNIPPFDRLFPSDKLIKIEKNNYNQLKFKLNELLSIDNRQKFGLEGQKFVSKNFTLQNMAKKYFELFENDASLK